MSHAIGEARSRQYDIRQAAFWVDAKNDAMLRFVREIKAEEQKSSLIFTLDF